MSLMQAVNNFRANSFKASKIKMLKPVSVLHSRSIILFARMESLICESDLGLNDFQLVKSNAVAKSISYTQED